MPVTFSQLGKELQKREFAQVYLFYGEEPYYIDVFSDYLIEHLLNDTEKEFNQIILYGRDTGAVTAVNYCRQFPMIGEKQLVVIREAQDMEWKKDETYGSFIAYLQAPTPSTVLVIDYKGKTPPAKFLKAAEASSVTTVFESKPISDRDIPEWIADQVKRKGFTIAPKACTMLLEFLGNDLEKIINELSKLYINHPKEKIISEEVIEKYIGISKDYNIFELQSALARKDVLKVNRIVNHFALNPKENSIFRTIPMLFSFFSTLMSVHSLRGLGEYEVDSRLKLKYYMKKDCEVAVNYYPVQKVQDIISWLRECNTRAIGIDNYSVDEGELLRELVFKILH